MADVVTVPILHSPNGETLIPSLNGVEIPNTRAPADLFDKTMLSFRYSADLTTAVSLRVEYSLNSGSSWSLLANAVAPLGQDTTTWSGWHSIPSAAKTDILVRVLAIGLIQVRVHFIDLQVI